MHQAQIHAESVLFVCPALSFVKSPLRFPSYRPSGRSFCILVPDTPGPEFVGNSRARARRSPARGFQRLQAPLGAARKPTTPLGVSHGEVRKPTAPPGVRHGEAGKSTTLPGLLHGEVRKPTAPPGLLHGEARKPTTTVAFARAGLFRPRGRPERRASL